jgi:hypothetical protein
MCVWYVCGEVWCVEELDGYAVRALRAIAEAKQRSQRPVIGWVTKIYYLELLRASEGTLSNWSRLHLQSFVPEAKYLRRPIVKTIAESLSQHDETML